MLDFWPWVPLAALFAAIVITAYFVGIEVGRQRQRDYFNRRAIEDRRRSERYGRHG
jgi:hypothetical protein